MTSFRLFSFKFIQIQKMRKDLPPVSYVDCINLEVMTMEMQCYGLPSKAQWQEIDKFSKLKGIIG
jgi:hypothetical protein